MQVYKGFRFVQTIPHCQAMEYSLNNYLILKILIV